MLGIREPILVCPWLESGEADLSIVWFQYLWEGGGRRAELSGQHNRSCSKCHLPTHLDKQLQPWIKIPILWYGETGFVISWCDFFFFFFNYYCHLVNIQKALSPAFAACQWERKHNMEWSLVDQWKAWAVFLQNEELDKNKCKSLLVWNFGLSDL